ncbi:hypothetical protein NA57DRAFT_73486 [Rhizodiscina lignyota]|uniref:Uncharacterized protein n=1 Tax=Rhizodiscina lignyota TaxID=1504668 RepID=A0A9P4ILQ5_9PEZI|nr:hypothetical protein NA57DRAFT_73486 [Rhizodiscina lignyota]
MLRPFNNVEVAFIFRIRAAYALYDTERHQECVEQLMELLWEPELPYSERLRVNMILACAVDDWDGAESYRLEAERVYQQIRQRWPLGSEIANQFPDQERMLDSARQSLDNIAGDQLEARPSPSAEQDQEQDQGDTEITDDLLEAMDALDVGMTSNVDMASDTESLPVGPTLQTASQLTAPASLEWSGAMSQGESSIGYSDPIDEDVTVTLDEETKESPKPKESTDDS